jgi:tripartite-type tricarboxylate transporter receptor subunit TctC
MVNSMALGMVYSHRTADFPDNRSGASMATSRRMGATLMLTVTAFSPLPSLAQSKGDAYPDRPIRLIVPFPPGGGTDLVSRTILPGWTAAAGQQIVIDNRGGAQGLLGTGLGAKATPDGYTLTIAEIGAVAVMPAMTPKVQFDALKDFAPITQLIEQPYIMGINPSVAAKTLPEFIQLAKAKSGGFNYGSGNATAHVAQELFFRTAAVKMQHIPYRGSGPSMQALLGGEVQVIFSGPGAAIPQVRAGKIRALAVTTGKRSRELPEVPTLSEQGFKGFEISGWYGLVAPAGTPAAIIKRINADVVKVLSSGEAPQLLRTRGYDPTPTAAEDFGRFMRAEVARWTKAVKDYGITSSE